MMPDYQKELSASGADPMYRFRLYIAKNAFNSVQAVANLNALCREYLSGNHLIELVDVRQEPQRALADGVLVTPTLIKVSPLPVRIIIGNLSDRATVIETLGLGDDYS